MVGPLGEIAERGTRDDLLAAGDLSARLWQIQAGLLDGLRPEFIERVATRAASRSPRATPASPSASAR